MGNYSGRPLGAAGLVCLWTYIYIYITANLSKVSGGCDECTNYACAPLAGRKDIDRLRRGINSLNLSARGVVVAGRNTSNSTLSLATRVAVHNKCGHDGRAKYSDDCFTGDGHGHSRKSTCSAYIYVMGKPEVVLQV